MKPSTSWASSAILFRAAIRGPGCPPAGAQVLIPPGACQPDSETPGISSQTFSPHHLDAGPHNNFFCCTMYSRLWPWISRGWRPVPCSTGALWFGTSVHASSRLLASTAKYSSCWAFVSLASSLVASAAFNVCDAPHFSWAVADRKRQPWWAARDGQLFHSNIIQYLLQFTLFAHFKLSGFFIFSEWGFPSLSCASWPRPASYGNTSGGVCSIFLRVERSIN